MSDLKWYINNFILSKAMLCMIDIEDKFRMFFLPWDELNMNEGIKMNF